MQHTAKHIYHTITNARHILLIPHQHPDGDALGSVTAFMHVLTRIGKSYKAFCHTPLSERQKYLPYSDKITSDPATWTDHTFDVIIVFDSGDLQYAGVAEYISRLSYTPTIINIDHHISNPHFGHHNLVLPNVSSTSEILHSFFSHTNTHIDATMATSLLAGILYDTDNFTNAATSEQTLRIGSDLIRRGAAVDIVRAGLFRDKSIKTLRVWGLVFSRIQKYEPLDIVYSYISQADLHAHGVQEKDYEGIANFFNNLGEGKVSMFLKEQKTGTIKGSFRTTQPDIDVAAWAGFFGGGGHKKAAGFTVDGPIDTALSHIFTTITAASKHA